MSKRSAKWRRGAEVRRDEDEERLGKELVARATKRRRSDEEIGEEDNSDDVLRKLKKEK